MADRPERAKDGNGERPPKVPPVVPPVVPPTVPPVAKPVVPPTVPPVARPVVPPTVPPAVPPTVPPTVPPVRAPVAPPTMKPVAPPTALPTVAPVVKPVASPAPTSAGGKAGGKSSASRSDKPERAPRGGAAAVAAIGMGVAPKVAILAAMLTALILAVAVIPATKRGDAEPDPHAAFRAAGAHLATGLASGLAGVAPPATAAGSSSSGRSPMLSAVDLLAGGLESDVKSAGLGGDLRGALLGKLGLLKDIGAARPASALQKSVDEQLDAISEGIKRAGNDQDRLKPLREQKDLFTRVASLLESAPTAAAAAPPPSGAGMALPAGAGGYRPLAVWWLDASSRLVGQSDRALPAPSSANVQTLDGATWFETAVSGQPAHVFVGRIVSPARTAAGQVLVALATPPATGGGRGGSNSLGVLLVFVGPLLVGALVFGLAKGISTPLKNLARELDRLGASGDPGRRIPAQGPEANAIARCVERMVSNLKFRAQHEMADLAEASAKVEGTAAEIHHGLMPRNPPRIPGWEVETLFKPGFEIGGDHFDYFRIDDTHLGVILMDTSVRGIPAAIVMSMARAYVRAAAPGVLSPGELLMRVNRLLASDLSQGQYATALYAVIDTENGTAKVASAGHLPLVIYRHALGKTAIVNPEGIALGLDVGPVFDRSVTEVELEIHVGDRLVLHTDGAVKVQNETGEEFGEKRLYEAVKQKAPMNSQAFVNFVGSGIDAFHATTPQNDDITISTVKRLK